MSCICSSDDPSQQFAEYKIERHAPQEDEAGPLVREPMPLLKSLASHVARELCEDVERELALSQREVRQGCSGSTSLTNLWGRFFQASENAAFRAVALEISQKPGGESIQFSADLTRRSKGQRFGFECTEGTLDSGVLLVTGVERGGCVEAWNDYCAQLNVPWKRLHLCAAILSVNGVAGDYQQMRQELGSCTQAVLVACNPPALFDAIGVLRVVRAAAPPPEGEPFWAAAQKKVLAVARRFTKYGTRPTAPRNSMEASSPIPVMIPDQDSEDCLELTGGVSSSSLQAGAAGVRAGRGDSSDGAEETPRRPQDLPPSRHRVLVSAPTTAARKAPLTRRAPMGGALGRSMPVPMGGGRVLNAAAAHSDKVSSC